MNVAERCKFSFAYLTLFQVMSKVMGLISTCLTIEITDQVFSSVANWSLFHVVHYLFLDHSNRFASEFLQAHVQLSQGRIKPALHRTQRHIQHV